MREKAQSDTAISPRQILSYGFLALPIAFAGLPLYIHIPDFYTRELGVGIASAGAILMALRLLDAVQDPLIGYISDKSPRHQQWILKAGLVALLSGMGILLMGPVALIPVEYWFAGGVALTALGLSASGINFVMIGSLWRREKSARARISAVREAMSLVGMLLASVLPAVFFLSMSKAEAFKIFYVVFAFLLLAGSMAFFRFYSGLPARHDILKVKKQGDLTRLPLRFFRQNSGFLTACFLTHIAASFPAVLFLYFVTDYLGSSNQAGLFLFAYFLSGAGFMPVWLRLARTYSLERTWLISMVTAISTFVWAFSLSEGNTLQFAIICILSGAALGADLALPPAIMAGRLERQGTESYAAQAYAIINLIPKVALALSTGCALLLLDAAGFSPSQVNTADALWVLAALYALIPCAMKATSALIIFYLDKGAKHDNQKRSSVDGYTFGT